MPGAIIIGSIIVIFIILGIVLYSGRGSSLIAGYNTMPKEERKRYDEVALSKFMGKMMFALSFSMVFWALSSLFDIDWLFIIGLILFISIVVAMLVYMNTGNRFKH